MAHRFPPSTLSTVWTLGQNSFPMSYFFLHLLNTCYMSVYWYFQGFLRIGLFLMLRYIQFGRKYFKKTRSLDNILSQCDNTSSIESRLTWCFAYCLCKMSPSKETSSQTYIKSFHIFLFQIGLNKNIADIHICLIAWQYVLIWFRFLKFRIIFPFFKKKNTYFSW